MLLLDGTNFEGGGWSSPWCRACQQPILPGQRATRVDFANDPDGIKGLTGQYHTACSKPFASMAHIVNMRPWGGH